MKKMNRLNGILFIFVLISLGLMAFIVYWNDSFAYSMPIILGCIAYFFLYVLYLVILAVWNTSKMNNTEKKEKIVKFLVWFAGLSAMNVTVSFLTSSGINGYDFFTSFGLAIGIAFSDVMFFKRKSY